MIIDTRIVWIIKVSPILKGCFVVLNIILVIIEVIISISVSSLLKMLILGINDEHIASFWSFKDYFYLWFTRSLFLFKLLKLVYLIYYLGLLFMVFSGLFIFCSMRRHLLLTLLSLEFLVLSLYFLFFLFLTLFGSSYYFLLVFLTFAVCEGAVGLGILVTIIRCHGNDGIRRLSILGW